MSTFACTRCGRATDLLEEFPGRICLSCWAQQEQHKAPPTAAEVAAMWRDPKIIRRRRRQPKEPE